MKVGRYKMNVKSNKGISLIMLVITIAMILIIVSIAVFSSKSNTPEAKLASAFVSLQAVREACKNAENLIEINPDEYNYEYFFGHNLFERIEGANKEQTITNLISEKGIGITREEFDHFSNKTYVIKSKDDQIVLENQDYHQEDLVVLERLDLNGVSETYIVDLENGLYYLVGGTGRPDSTKVYEYRDIENTYELLK